MAYRILRDGQRLRNRWLISAAKVINLSGADGQYYAEYSRVFCELHLSVIAIFASNLIIRKEICS